MNKLEDVKEFWENNPLFSGEEKFDPNCPSEFFAAHDKTYFTDVFKGIDFRDTFYLPMKHERVLDLGCGIGFWSSLFMERYSVSDLTSADLTNAALEIAKIRVPLAKFSQENAERLQFENESFDFVNCQGVIHHTPNTQACFDEIFRVLKTGGRASVSVYYRNILIRLAALYFPIIRLFSRLFLRNLGRGREFSQVDSVDDLVRLYDGSENPIGKAYSRTEILKMAQVSGFKDIEVSYFFFPFRFLKFRIPNFMAKFILRIVPFMIVLNIKK